MIETKRCEYDKLHGDEAYCHRPGTVAFDCTHWFCRRHYTYERLRREMPVSFDDLTSLSKDDVHWIKEYWPNSAKFLGL